MFKLPKWWIDEEIWLSRISAFWDVFLMVFIAFLIYLNRDIGYMDTWSNILLICSALLIIYILFRTVHRFERILNEPYFDFEGNLVVKKYSWIAKRVINPFFLFVAFLVLTALFKIQFQFLKWLEKGFEFAGLTVSVRTIIISGFVFLGLLVGTRFIQRIVLSKLKDSVEMGIAFKNSLLSGIGFLGLILAVCGFLTSLGANILPFIILVFLFSTGLFLGFKEAIQNFMAGLVILWERPIKIGDWIVLDGEEGFVRKITLCSTQIETFDKASIIFPNSKIISGKIENWTHMDTIGRTEVNIIFPYGTKLDPVKKILLKVAKNHPSVLETPVPSVVVIDIPERRVTLSLRCFIPNKVQRLSIANTLREEIYNALMKAKIKV